MFFLVLGNSILLKDSHAQTKSAIKIGSNQIDSSKTLAPLQINGIRYPHFFTGSKFSLLDSNSMALYQQQNLSDLLMNQSMIFIKSYGGGMLASPGFRGGNANHTAVLWNGFNLQSPMNGQVDLATIPSFLIEGVAIQYGSPAALFGTGNIGGAVHLLSDETKEKGFVTKLLLGTGSNAAYTGGAKIFLTQKKFRMQQKVYWQQAENNYAYKAFDQLQPQAGNTVSAKDLQKLKMQNAALSTVAWVQGYQYVFGLNQNIGLNTWVQKNERELPVPLHGSNTHAKQSDVTNKILMDYHLKKSIYEMQARYGYFYDMVEYQDDNSEISKSVSHKHTAYLDNFIYQGNHHLQMSGMMQATQANLNTVANTWNQKLIAVYATYKRSHFEKLFQHQISLRQEWVNGKPIPLMPSYGFNIHIHKSTSVYGNVARSYRLPTFNDLYWPEMGNPNLEAEHGWNEEITLANYISVKGVLVQTALTVFNKTIQDWILWVPKGGNLSTPMNVYQVWSRGVELDWKMQKTNGNLLLKFGGLHDYTLASPEASHLVQDESIGKQLIYTPKIKNQLQVTGIYKKTSLAYFFHYIGTRYVSSDHSNWLDPYTFSTLSVSHAFAVKKKQGTVQFLLNNLFNQTYQIMVNRPMPLIQYQINLNLTI